MVQACILYLKVMSLNSDGEVSDFFLSILKAF